MIHILIVDDHAVVRDGVQRLVDEQFGAAVFGEASTAQEALQQLRPQLPVLILSMHAEDQYARRAFKAGAAGYITKDSSRAELITALNKVIHGGKYVSPRLTEQLVASMARGTDQALHEALSDRELEVMSLIASGKTVSQIAELLSLSDKTISTYRARILEKMRMKTNAELTYYAIQNRLVS
jgi:two-component system invasion response regulator UvrY